MPMFILQSALLIAIAYILGCIIGRLLHHYFSTAKTEPTAIVVKEKHDSPVTGLKQSARTSDKIPEQKEMRAKPTSQKTAKPKSKTTRKSKEKPVKIDTKITTGDDLKRIKGIGPQNEARLKGMGISSFIQIAAWTSEEQQEFGERLSFQGRIEREDWVKQAQILADGGKPNIAKRVDKREVVPSSGEMSNSELGVKPHSFREAPEDGVDDLTLVGGIGSALESKLNAVGIYTFEQISNWNKDHQDWIGNELGFRGRPEREDWVENARKLMLGDGVPSKSKPVRGQITAKRKKKTKIT